jgi:hypothetical protein
LKAIRVLALGFVIHFLQAWLESAMMSINFLGFVTTLMCQAIFFLTKQPLH